MKKIIALLLALVMVLSLMACTAKEEPEKEEEKPADSEQKPAEDKKEEDKKEEDKQEEEPAEKEIVPGELPLVAEGEEAVITIGLRADVKTENYETNEYTLWLEEQTGVDLQFVTFSSDKDEALTQLNLMLSGGQELPDILWGFNSIGTAMMYELGADGYLVDISDYFDEYGYYFWDAFYQCPEADQPKILDYAKSPIDGGIYAMPRYAEIGIDKVQAMVTINTKWLEAVEMDAPTNVDELYEVLKAFAEQDPNGNGEKDELPLVGDPTGYIADFIQWIINAWVYCNDKFTFNVTDGELWIPYDTDEYRQALIYLNKLYAEGLLAAQTYTIADYAEMTSLYTPTDGVAIAGVVGACPTLTMEKDNALIYDYAAMGPLAAETELGGYGALHSNTFAYETFITTDCDDPVLAFRLLDFMSGTESLFRNRFGTEGVDWRRTNETDKPARNGNPATVVILNPEVYTGTNNKSWHLLSANISSGKTWSHPYDDSDTSWIATRTKLMNTMLDLYKEAGAPEEVIYKLIYNEEETNALADIQKPLQDFITERRAMFITNNLDPNSDSDWNEYLNALENQGMYDWLEMAQTAYNRMKA